MRDYSITVYLMIDVCEATCFKTEKFNVIPTVVYTFNLKIKALRAILG